MSSSKPRPGQLDICSMPAHNPHRPSISSTMHWLSRKDSKSSPERSGGLQGATIVRTPEDALRDTNVRVTFESKAQAPPSSSPPLPPLPLPAEDETQSLEDEAPRRPQKPHRPVPRAPSPTPSSNSSLRPSLKSRSSTAVEDPPHVPPLPSHVPLSDPIPPFSPILVSAPPSLDADPTKTIVTLETCTTTYKSTLFTLCSRPSFLADYLTSVAKPRTSQASSVYSTESTDVETYRDHLASQGLLQPASCSTSLHIFLDRPSAPYAHILVFLRTPSISAEYPSTLPRGVQLTSFTHSTSSSLFNAKLEALLELRDETAYLGLDQLNKLCTDEIRQRLAQAQRHIRGISQASVNTMIGPGLLPSVSGGGSPSIQSHHASVYSLHTLIERAEGDMADYNGKKVQDRDSRCSESYEEDDTLPPLNLPTSPLPVPTPTIVTTPPIVSSVSAPPKLSPTALPVPSPKHIKNISVSSQSTVATTTRSTARPSSKSFSPAYTPPHSASSSPGQLYARSPYLHKKAESVSVLPMRSPPLPVADVPVSAGGPRRPESKPRGRIATSHHGPSSPSVGGFVTSPPPGWI